MHATRFLLLVTLFTLLTACAPMDNRNHFWDTAWKNNAVFASPETDL